MSLPNKAPPTEGKMEMGRRTETEMETETERGRGEQGWMVMMTSLSTIWIHLCAVGNTDVDAVVISRLQGAKVEEARASLVTAEEARASLAETEKEEVEEGKSAQARTIRARANRVRTEKARANRVGPVESRANQASAVISSKKDKAKVTTLNQHRRPTLELPLPLPIPILMLPTLSLPHLHLCASSPEFFPPSVPDPQTLLATSALLRATRRHEVERIHDSRPTHVAGRFDWCCSCCCCSTCLYDGISFDAGLVWCC